jgi:WD40 repeat protein
MKSLRFVIPFLVLVMIFSISCTAEEGLVEEKETLTETVEPKTTETETITETVEAEPVESEIIAKYKIAFSKAGIWLMNIDGSEQVKLTNTLDNNPSFSPDGSKLVFEYKPDIETSEIYILDVDGSKRIRLTNNLANDWSPSFSPDGSKIVFNSDGDGNIETSEIYIMDVDGSNQEMLTNNKAWNASPCFSPDGSKIAFMSNLDGDYEIYLMNIDGTELVNLTNNPGNEGSPSFSPDGSKIVFSAYRNENRNIYIMDVDGSNQEMLTNNTANNESPCFSPNGSKIAFMSNLDGDYEIYLMNIDGTEQTRLTNSNIPTLSSGLSFSPVPITIYLETTFKEETEVGEPIKEEIVEEEPVEEPKPIPEPNIYEGSGDDIVDIEKPGDEPLAIMYVRGNEASRHFAINGYDTAGEKTHLFVNTTDPYEGIVQLNVDSRRGDTTRLEVSGTGSWYIEVRSLRSARPASAPGEIIGGGDEVFLVEGELDTAFITGNDAGRHFAIKGYNSRGNLLVNTTDPYEGRVMVPSDISVVEVTGVGEWEINFE